MKKLLLIGLILGNAVGLVLLSAALLPQGHADSGLVVSDLTYGSIDTDGNGVYDGSDDYMVEWFLNNAPQHLTSALEKAVVNTDGGVNLSPYLLTFTAESVEAAKTQEGK